MPITIPNTFTTGTPVLASSVNANFTEVGTKALNRTGNNTDMYGCIIFERT